eukprot:jgi/Ulvmu1/12017/UM083_0030.1
MCLAILYLLIGGPVALGVVRSQVTENHDSYWQDWGELSPQDFLDTDFIVQRFHDVNEGMFDKEPAVQESAARALQYLIEPMLSPYKFRVPEVASRPGMYYDDYYNSRGGDVLHGQLVDRLDPDAILAMAEAAFALGVLHSTGMLPVVEKDDKRATALYALAASHGSVSGNLAMAHRHEQGYGLPKSCSLAYQHLKSAALAFADEAHTEGTFPQKPRPVLLRERERDAAYMSDAELLFGNAEQLDLEYALADRGDPDAMSRLALRQLIGLGVEADAQGAVRAFEAAAAAGDPMSMLTLGLVHTNGIGVETNHTRARELFLQASKHSVPAAYNALGHLYLNGLGVATNATMARSLFEVGAELGDPDATFNLALLHMYGLPDMPVNTTRAFDLLRAAHDAEQWKAPLLLAELYHEHPAVPGGVDCGKALQHLWIFVRERSDFSELSMDALEMATGIPQPGGTAAARTPAAGAAAPPPLPHEPRRALMLYVMMAEQGCLTASMNAAWLLERGTHAGVQEGRDDLIQYMYLRAALADSPAAAVDYANWLLRRHAGRDTVAAEQLDRRGAQGAGGTRGAVGLRSGTDAWPVLLRLGIADSTIRAHAGAAEQARLLYTHAEKLRDAEAATNLGWMYMVGVGAPRNLTQAQEQYLAAIAMATNEAEKLAPRLALMCARAWSLADRLLPPAVVNLVLAAGGHCLNFVAAAFWAVLGRLGAAATTVQARLPHVELM